MTELDSETADAKGRSAGQPEAPGMALHLTNLVLLVATGVWFSLWFHHNTEWFPIIGGVLGLGSFFAWGAFVTGLLTDDRKSRYQQLFDETVLSNRHFVVFVLLCNLLFIVLAPAGHGGLRIINASATESLTVRVLPVVTQPTFIGPQQEVKLALPTPWFCATPFLCQQDYTLDISDTPALPVQLRAFSRQTLILPSAAWRQRLALVRPATEANYRDITNPHLDYYLRLKICKGGAPSDCQVLHDGYAAGEELYQGGAYIVGTQEDVLLPDEVIQRWRSQGLPSEIVTRWSRPLRPKVSPPLNGDGPEVAAELLGPDGEVVCTASHLFTEETSNMVEIEIGIDPC